MLMMSCCGQRQAVNSLVGACHGLAIPVFSQLVCAAWRGADGSGDRYWRGAISKVTRPLPT